MVTADQRSGQNNYGTFDSTPTTSGSSGASAAGNSSYFGPLTNSTVTGSSGGGSSSSTAQAISNEESAYNAMYAGYITYDAYAANALLNGITPRQNPWVTASSGTSTSASTGNNGVNFGPNEGADWMRTGSGLSFEEFWGVGPYGTLLLKSTPAINEFAQNPGPSNVKDPSSLVAPPVSYTILDYIMSKHNASNAGTVFSYAFEEQDNALGIFPRKPILYITIGTEIHPIDYYMIGDIVIINSDALIKIFKLKDKDLYRHQFGINGDRYESPDIAALAWGLTYWNESNSIGEYGAWIYKEAEGVYFVGDFATQGLPDSVTLDQPIEGYSIVASIHTHPTSLIFPNNSFSQADLGAAYENSCILGYEFRVYIVSGNKVRSTSAEPRPHFAQPHLTRGYQSVDERTVYSGLRYS